MKISIKQMPILLEEALEDLPILRKNAADPGKDRTGSASNVLSNVLRFTAVAEFVVNSDVGAFRGLLKESAQIRHDLIGRYKAGQSVSRSYVSMINYKALFNALASTHMGLARSLAFAMDASKELVDEYDTDLDASLGRALRAIVIGSDDQGERIERLKEKAGESDEAPLFLAISELLGAFVSKPEVPVDRLFETFVVAHRRSQIFSGTEDALVSVWGVGIANLMKDRGLSVAVDDKLIPKPLWASA